MNGLKFPRQWELVNNELRRLRIPNGWLVLSSTQIIRYDKEVAVAESLVFIQDEEGIWQLEAK